MSQAAVPIINPNSPRAGVHLADHTVFAACGVMVAAYRRNTFNTEDTPSGVKTCLKILSVPRYKANDYGSFKSGSDRVSLELELHHAQKLAAVLYGRDSAMQVSILRKGKPKKTLSLKRQANSEAPLYFTMEQGAVTHSTPLTGADGWQFLMVVTRLLKELQPEIDDKVLLETFVRTA